MNKVLNIGALVLDQKLQSRTEINEQTIEDYADAIKLGDEFPPVLAYFDGVHYYLTDGYHRYHAHKKAEKVSILCSVVNGTFRDAVLHATGVNAKHGMRRTHADKRKAVMTLLDDFEWSDWSNAEIARQCGVSPTFVANLRDSGGPAEVKYKTSGGNVATKTKAPGRAAKEPELKEPPKQEQEPAPVGLDVHVVVLVTVPTRGSFALGGQDGLKLLSRFVVHFFSLKICMCAGIGSYIVRPLVADCERRRVSSFAMMLGLSL